MSPITEKDVVRKKFCLFYDFLLEEYSLGLTFYLIDLICKMLKTMSSTTVPSVSPLYLLFEIVTTINPNKLRAGLKIKLNK